MTTLQEKRHRETTNSIARVLKIRDAAFATLLRCETKLKALRKLEARQARALAKPQPAPAPLPVPVLLEELAKLEPQPDDDGLPAFLDRRPKGMQMAPGAAAAVEVRAQQTEKRKAKSRGRIAKLKAKQAGDLKRMPLTGNDALRFIQQR